MDYSREDGLYVLSAVGIFVTAKQGQAAYAAVVQPLLPRCLGVVSPKSSQESGPARVRYAGPLPFPRYGDRSAAFRIVSDLTSHKKVVRTTLDVVVVNRGAANVTMWFIVPGKGLVPSSMERRIVGRVSARMAAS